MGGFSHFTRVAKNAKLLLRDPSQPKCVIPSQIISKDNFKKPLYRKIKMILWSCGFHMMWTDP